MSLQAIVTHSRILITVVEPDSALRFLASRFPCIPHSHAVRPTESV